MIVPEYENGYMDAVCAIIVFFGSVCQVNSRSVRSKRPVSHRISSRGSHWPSFCRSKPGTDTTSPARSASGPNRERTACPASLRPGIEADGRLDAVPVRPQGPHRTVGGGSVPAPLRPSVRRGTNPAPWGTAPPPPGPDPAPPGSPAGPPPPRSGSSPWRRSSARAIGAAQDRSRGRGSTGRRPARLSSSQKGKSSGTSTRAAPCRASRRAARPARLRAQNPPGPAPLGAPAPHGAGPGPP